MNIIEHLDLIDRLVAEQKAPGEIRGHIIAIREALEAYAEKSKYLLKLEAENERLVAENARLVALNPTPDFRVINQAPFPPIEPLI